jgi:hypothetical protein
MFKKIILSMLVWNSSLSACCGCALVINSMNSLTTAIQQSVELGDKTTATLYSNTAGVNIGNSLRETERRLRELSNTLQIKRLGVNCENEIIFELKKSNNIESVIKSVEIYNKQ